MQQCALLIFGALPAARAIRLYAAGIRRRPVSATITNARRSEPNLLNTGIYRMF
jgi:hypothetical protein